MLDQVAAGRNTPLQRGHRLRDLGPDTFAKFAAGVAVERDQQHVVERHVGLGQVAGDQPGQRERLAGAGAGLQHGGGALFG